MLARSVTLRPSGAVHLISTRRLLFWPKLKKAVQESSATITAEATEKPFEQQDTLQGQPQPGAIQLEAINATTLTTATTNYELDADQINLSPNMRLKTKSRRLVHPHQLRAAFPRQNIPALFAMRARLGLAPESMDLDILRGLCSFGKSKNRNMLAGIGAKRLDERIRQHLKQTYPNMSDMIVERVKNCLTADDTLKLVGQDLGLHHAAMDGEMLQKFPQTVRALIGACQEPDADRLIRHHFLLRPINWGQIIDFDYPNKALEELVKDYYNTTPAMRLLSESGRKSPMPIFVVGVFAGVQKLGEGFGQSLSMAQHRARMDALRKHYLRRQPVQKIDCSYVA